jgi:Integrase core domain
VFPETLCLVSLPVARWTRERSSAVRYPIRFNVAPQPEDILGFMNETICHLALLGLLHVYGKHDVELMAEICGLRAIQDSKVNSHAAGREIFNSRLRDEFLNGEIFYSIKEIRILEERWRIHYHTVRPHSSLGFDRQCQSRGRAKSKQGMEKWKANYASHFSTPSTAAT